MLGNENEIRNIADFFNLYPCIFHFCIVCVYSGVTPPNTYDMNLKIESGHSKPSIGLRLVATRPKRRLVSLLLMICLLSMFTSVSGQGGKDLQVFYPSGKVEMVRKYDESCNCVRVSEFYESGKVRATQTYLQTGPLSSQIKGEDIRYFEDGTIQTYYYWEDGAPVGRNYANYPNGKLAYEKYFVNSFKTGMWKFYHEDGTLKEAFIYEEMKTRWDSQDDDAVQIFYLDGKQVYSFKLVAGKKTDLTVVDSSYYKRFIASTGPDGEKLFTRNCVMCHSANVDIVGPKMKGVAAKRSREWLVRMISNGDALQKGGDKVANDLYQKWNNIQHPNFERFDSREVNAIISYLNELK